MRRLNPAIAAALALSAASAMSARNAHAIRNGTVIGESTHPEVGFLYPGCTATLINENTVLTANHCVYPNNLAQNKFEIQIAGQRTEVEASAVRILSKDYDQELALIRLKSKISGIAPARLSKDLPALNQKILGVGFGLPYSLRGKKQSGVYRIDQIQKIDFGDGPSPYPVIAVVPGPKKQLPCGGDSGGPVFNAQGALIGIASFILGAPDDQGFDYAPEDRKCDLAQRAVYVPVAPHLEWIDSALHELDAEEGQSSPKRGPASAPTASGCEIRRIQFRMNPLPDHPLWQGRPKVYWDSKNVLDRIRYSGWETNNVFIGAFSAQDVGYSADSLQACKALAEQFLGLGWSWSSDARTTSYCGPGRRIASHSGVDRRCFSLYVSTRVEYRFDSGAQGATADEVIDLSAEDAITQIERSQSEAKPADWIRAGLSLMNRQIRGSR